jgi:hypothetical protein
MKIDYQTFLELAKKMTEDQYGEEDRSYQEILDEREYLASQEIRKHIDASSSANISSMKRDKIKEAIVNNGNLVIHNFVIKIHRYQGSAEKAAYEKKDLFNISLHEKGKNKMHNKVQIMTDYRFKEMPWISYFRDPIKGGKDIPIDTLIEIIRYLQVISKMDIFL